METSMIKNPKTSKVMPTSAAYSIPPSQPIMINTNNNDPTEEVYRALVNFINYCESQNSEEISQKTSAVLFQIWKLLSKILTRLVQSDGIIGIETTVSTYNNRDPNAVSWAHILEDTYRRNTKIVYKDISLFNKDELDTKIAKLNLDHKVVTKLLYDNIDF